MIDHISAEHFPLHANGIYFFMKLYFYNAFIGGLWVGGF